MTARVAAGLADSDHVHDLVQAAVTCQRNSVPDHLAAGGFDGSHARVGGEMSLAREPRDVADDPHDLGREDSSYAEDPGEGGARGLNFFCDATLQVGDPPIEGSHVSH